MKKLLPFLIALALPAAAFDVPRQFFPLEKIDEACAEAAGKPELVGFLITDPKMQPS